MEGKDLCSCAERIKKEDSEFRTTHLAKLKDICFGKMCTYANIDFKECAHISAYRKRLEAEQKEAT